MNVNRFHVSGVEEIIKSSGLQLEEKSILISFHISELLRFLEAALKMTFGLRNQ